MRAHTILIKMNDWPIVQQDIERLHNSITQPGIAFSKLSDMYQEAIFLREHVYESTGEVDNDQIIEASRLLAEVEITLYHQIIAQANIASEEIEKWLHVKTLAYEKTIRKTISDVAESPELGAAKLRGYAGDLTFFKSIAAKVRANEDKSIVPEILNRIHRVVAQIESNETLVADKTLTDKLGEVRKDALLREVRAFEDEVDYLCKKNDSTFEQIWRSLAWGHYIQPNISYRNSDHQKLREECSQNREKLRQCIAAQIGKYSEQQQFLQKLAMRIYDQANDVLGQMEDYPLTITIKQLYSMREDTIWIKLLLKEQCETQTDDSLTAWYKKIRKIDKYLAGELQEKKLLEKLQQKFGKTFVSRFEMLILFLIFAVVGFLTIEMTFDLSPRTQNIFMWIDTGICAVFLLEFFTKLILVEGKALYFRRHWFLDFLPSIPFGLLSANIEFLNNSRVLRALRLTRLLRYVRILRPLIRLFRVISFLLRGVDRLVNRYSRWLNRNIIVFGSREEVGERSSKTIESKLQDLYGSCLVRSQWVMTHASPELSTPFYLCYLEVLDVHIRHSNGGHVIQETTQLTLDILVEDVIENLLVLKGPQVEEILGNVFPYKLHRYMGFFNVPIMRSLPVIRGLLLRHSELSPPEFAAYLGRLSGRTMQKILAVIYWFTDFFGIVTGPRLIDRLGSALVTSFQRPAKKLLIIGCAFLALNFLLSALDFTLLEPVVKVLEKFIGIPMMLIGGICLIPVGLGLWLRSIAGEATEFYERTAEAQFINLLEDLKLSYCKEDLGILYNRVLLPETMLRANDEYQTNETVLVHWMQSALDSCGEPIHKAKMTTIRQARNWELQHKIILLYKDYLDGAPLHYTDVKTTEQLLGNITIGNILEHRLDYGRKEFKKLEKLDLNHGGVLGPYLWFSLITQTIAHNTAQLIVDYNKNCIKKAMIPVQTEEIREMYYRWLRQRSQQEDPMPESQVKKTKKKKKREQSQPLYLTTQFTALHFLTCDEEQDEVIHLQFEEELYQTFLSDRKQAIREVFASYPLQDLPKGQRTFNLYFLYREHMAGGMVFLLPFKAMFWVGCLLWIAVKWVYQKVLEILHPALEKKTAPSKSDFRVAVRKINRMRKPIYVECMKIRAQFDFEYLGLQLPDIPGLPADNLMAWDEEAHDQTAYPFVRDLNFIDALDSERDYFFELRQNRQQRLHEWFEFLQKKDWHGEGFVDYLKSIDEGLAERKNEILRALSMAYTIDYRHLASLLHAKENLEAVFDDVIKNCGKLSSYRWYQNAYLLVYRFITNFAFIKKDSEEVNFNTFWENSRYKTQYSDKEKKWCWKAYLAHRSFLKKLLEFIGGDVHIIEDILNSIIRNTESWTEEIIAMRTIQSLAVMDVRNYRRHIAELGEYPERHHYTPNTEAS